MTAIQTRLGSEQHVLELIEQDIVEQNITPGARLPTERDLAERSGVSRTTVRRALNILEAEGRVVQHVGRGTFLAPKLAPEPGSSEATSPAEIMAVRLLVEPQVMPLAVAAATPADLSEIQRCLEGGEAAEAYEDFEVWDIALHRAFTSATHNTLLASTMEMINGERNLPTWGTLKRRSSTLKRRNTYKQDHRNIATALAERNAAEARDAMRQHLLRVRTHVLGE